MLKSLSVFPMLTRKKMEKKVPELTNESVSYLTCTEFQLGSLNQPSSLDLGRKTFYGPTEGSLLAAKEARARKGGQSATLAPPAVELYPSAISDAKNSDIGGDKSLASYSMGDTGIVRSGKSGSDRSSRKPKLQPPADEESRTCLHLCLLFCFIVAVIATASVAVMHFYFNLFTPGSSGHKTTLSTSSVGESSTLIFISTEITKTEEVETYLTTSAVTSGNESSELT